VQRDRRRPRNEVQHRTLQHIYLAQHIYLTRGPQRL